MSVNQKDLESERLKSEIQFFAAITEKIGKSSDEKKPKKFSLTVILTIMGSFITVLTGGVALYMSVDKLVDQQTKAYSMTYSSQMIDLFDKSRNSEEYIQDQAVILLSSYEMDAVPMLLLNLENEEPAKQNIYIKSFNIIKNKKTVDEKELLNSIMESSLDYISVHFNEFSNDDIQKQKIYAIRNYIALLGGLSKGYESEVIAFFDVIIENLKAKKIKSEDLNLLETKVNKEIKRISND